MAYSPSITAKAGYNFVFQVSDGTSPTVFQTVAGLRNIRLTVNNAPADITNAGSQGFRELLPEGGIQSFSASAEGIFDSANSTTQAAIQEAAINRTYVEGKLVSGHGDFFVGNFVVASFERAGPNDQAETFNITLEGSGRISYFSS
jgi:TP901-1 family phage major tail protein